MTSQINLQPDLDRYANFKTLESALPETRAAEAGTEDDVKKQSETFLAQAALAEARTAAVEDSASKIKQIMERYKLILCVTHSWAMASREDGSEYGTRQHVGYVKKSNKDWTYCEAIYTRCMPVTPRTMQFAFDSSALLETFEYKVNLIHGFKMVGLRDTLLISNESYAKIPVTQNHLHTPAEMEAALKLSDEEIEEALKEE